MFEIKGINEECGVFGVSDHQDAALISYFGLHSLQHRGQEGAGIAYYQNKTIKSIKGEGLIAEVLQDKELESIDTSYVIGHVKYSNENTKGLVNVQPFTYQFLDESIALAHNGYIGNAPLLKKEIESNGGIFVSQSDSEVLIHLIRMEKGNFIDRLKNALNKLDGSFAFVLMHDNEIYGIRDRHGLRPLSIGILPNGSYILTSETCAFNVLNARFIRDVKPGEIVKISNKELVSWEYAKCSSENICLMEYVYFSRPDSSLSNINVHTARKASGRMLASSNKVAADIVVGVPDSSTSAAIGYAEASNIPYEIGLIKNRYVGRTFIQPTQELREQGVRMKLSAVREIVEGKDIILVDDSIVRGTTCKRIITLLKDAGANKIHARIASPAIKYPCYYGVDITDYKELISNRMNQEELREYISADSLCFLELDDLIKALNDSQKIKDHQTGYCSACFDGNYITSLYEDISDMNKKGEL
ncbi:MAG: amidophosphoribosyltransferase [Erysipelotrichales bacterium]